MLIVVPTEIILNERRVSAEECLTLFSYNCTVHKCL